MRKDKGVSIGVPLRDLLEPSLHGRSIRRDFGKYFPDLNRMISNRLFEEVHSRRLFMKASTGLLLSVSFGGILGCKCNGDNENNIECVIGQVLFEALKSVLNRYTTGNSTQAVAMFNNNSSSLETFQMSTQIRSGTFEASVTTDENIRDVAVPGSTPDFIFAYTGPNCRRGWFRFSSRYSRRS